MSVACDACIGAMPTRCSCVGGMNRKMQMDLGGSGPAGRGWVGGLGWEPLLCASALYV